jgi:hypothetical protein
MGDLRNKIAKQERDAAVQAMQRRLEASRPAERQEAVTCGGCGVSCLEAEVYSLPVGRWDPARFSCRACMPEDLRSLL